MSATAYPLACPSGATPTSADRRRTHERPSLLPPGPIPDLQQPGDPASCAPAKTTTRSFVPRSLKTLSAFGMKAADPIDALSHGFSSSHVWRETSHFPLACCSKTASQRSFVLADTPVAFDVWTQASIPQATAVLPTWRKASK